MKNLSIFILAIVVGYLLFIGYQKFASVNQDLIHNLIVPSAFNLDIAPTNALTGRITQFSGETKWQSRTATEPAQLTQSESIQQGESIETKTGTASVSFPQVFTMTISPNSSVSFTQTLPDNIVLMQTAGLVEYQNLGKDPISIRAEHLLINPDAGKISLNINDNIVLGKVITSNVTVGFNDDQNVTNKILVKAGKQFTFNDDTRKFSVR